jgi:hypothetical protein
MHQVVLEMSGTRKIHVICEFPSKEEAINKYMSLIKANKDSPITKTGKYNVRAKPETF